MGRSVDYLSGATGVAYFDVSCDCQDGCYHWDFFVKDITEQLETYFPSLSSVEAWDGRETKIILENNFSQIGISEYCGLASVSVRVNDDCINEGLAKSFTARVAKRLEKMTQLRPVGTFSNGERVFKEAK